MWLETFIKEFTLEYIIAILTILGSTVVIIANFWISKKQRTADIITKNRMEWIQNLRRLSQDYYKKVKFFHDKIVPKNKSNFLEELYLYEAKLKLQLNCFGSYDADIINYISELNKAYNAFLHKIILESKNPDKRKSSLDMIEYLRVYNPKLLDSKLKEIANGIDFVNEDLKKIGEKLNSPEYLKEIFNNLCEMEDKYMKECCKILKYLPDITLIYLQIYLKVEWERVKKESKKGNIKHFKFNRKFEKYLYKRKDEIEELKALLPVRISKNIKIKIPIMDKIKNRLKKCFKDLD